MVRIVCAITTCDNEVITDNYRVTGTGFHYFPCKRDMREKWLKSCGRKYIRFKKNTLPRCSFICWHHFKEEDFLPLERRLKKKPQEWRLQRHAIPTIFKHNSLPSFKKKSTRTFDSHIVEQGDCVDTPIKSTSTQSLDSFDVNNSYASLDSFLKGSDDCIDSKKSITLKSQVNGNSSAEELDCILRENVLLKRSNTALFMENQRLKKLHASGLTMENMAGISAGKVVCASVESECDTDIEEPLLPKESQVELLETLENFNKWRAENNIFDSTEETFLMYFRVLAEVNKPETLWNIYSMLKTIILQIENVNIEIYEKLGALLKDYGAKKKRLGTFSIANIKDFIENADDRSYLGMKTTLIIALAGDCIREELLSLQTDFIRIEHDKAVIEMPLKQNSQIKRFEITGKFFTVFRKYADLRPWNVPDNKFLLCFRRGKFTTFPVGINTISKIPKKIAIFLKLPNPETYNALCFRRTIRYLYEYFRTTKFNGQSNVNNFDESTIRANICNLIMESDDNMSQSIDVHDIGQLQETNKHAVKEVETKLKSNYNYRREFEKFNKWRNENGIAILNEETFLEYFRKLSEVQKPKTLVNTYAMLKSKLLEYDNLNIGSYARLRVFLNSKKLEDDKEKKTAAIFSKKDVKTFLAEADDFNYLGMKAVLIIGLAGACKRTELCNLKSHSVRFESDKAIVQIPTRSVSKGKVFEITGNFFTVFKKYADLRPSDVPGNKFFATYRNGKCVKVNMGSNYFGDIPKLVASFLKLPNPECYSGHSIRSTTIDYCAKFRGPLNERLKKFAEKFMGNTKSTKKSIELKTSDLVPESIDVTDQDNEEMNQENMIEDYMSEDNMIDDIQSTINTTINIDLRENDCEITHDDWELDLDDDPLKM